MAAAATLVAACSENSIAPAASAVDEPPAFEYGGGAAADLSATDTLRFSITIDPSRQTYYDLGSGNSITFPAGSLCDPARSSYGNNEWDKPCPSATAPVTVAVTAWLDSHGHPRTDFTPNVRFVPSSDPRQWVRITFSDFQASLDLSFNILYCPSLHSRCKDESKTDLTLITYRDPITHKLTRRIKHFSGYNVAAGDDGGDILDSFSSSLTVDTPFHAIADHSVPNSPLSRAHSPQTLSGYILASG
jgi:hypothetical protein